MVNISFLFIIVNTQFVFSFITAADVDNYAVVFE